MNDYDWLGNGVYFWANNAERALQWAEDHKKEKPAIIGAVIDLGYCMDLIDSEFLKELREAFGVLKKTIELTGKEMPKNEGTTPDKLLRKLDCAVIQTACQINSDAGFLYDSVRGVFWEGMNYIPMHFLKRRIISKFVFVTPTVLKVISYPEKLMRTI